MKSIERNMVVQLHEINKSLNKFCCCKKCKDTTIPVSIFVELISSDITEIELESTHINK